MYLHQVFNSTPGNVYNGYRYTACSFSPHFHKSFELLYLTRGCGSVRIENEDYRLNEGEFALILPYRLHSFTVTENAEVFVAVFSENYVREAAKIFSESEGETPVFRCSEPVKNLVFETLIRSSQIICGRQDAEPDGSEKQERPSLRLMKKAALYAACSEYLKSVPLIPKKRENDTVIRLLEWIAEHFREDISLKQAANELGYQFQYLSQLFNSAVHIHFKTLINQYRYEYACRQMLDHPEKSMTDIAFESGFQSIRSFNRVMKELGND